MRKKWLAGVPSALGRKMGRRRIGFWLGLAVAAAALVLPAVARAATNVVPNPGFEQGGCGSSTPIICGWRTTDPTASMRDSGELLAFFETQQDPQPQEV